jgi:hypothetical protein
MLLLCFANGTRTNMTKTGFEKHFRTSFPVSLETGKPQVGKQGCPVG